MNCDESAALLGDAVDAALSLDQERALQAHCLGCDVCRQLLADLKEIRAVATTLERHAPSPDLWTRIETKRVRVSNARRPVWVPFAAVALLAISIGTAAWIYLRPLRPTTPEAALSVDLARNAVSELQQAEEHYVNAITALEQLTANRQDSLDPLIAQAIDQSLTTINRAIGDSRAALEREPASLVVQTSLLEALRMKVALLQETVSLLSEAERGSVGESPKS